MSEIIGKRIKSLRQNKGMTQEELGSLLGVNKAAVQKYESGKVKLTADKIRILSRTFNKYARTFIWEDDNDYAREVLKMKHPEDFTVISEPMAARLIENYLERDVIDIVLAAVSLNTVGRKRLLEHAKLLDQIPEMRRRPTE